MFRDRTPPRLDGPCTDPDPGPCGMLAEALVVAALFGLGLAVLWLAGAP